MKLAICMVCRNSEKFLRHVFNNILLLDKYAPTVIIVYDNCTDNSPELINNFSKTYKYTTFIKHLENNNSNARTVRIANARNEYLDILSTVNPDFHIVIDSDDINIKPWNMEVIDYYIENNSHWDCVSFNGDNSLASTGMSLYYDKWALLVDNFYWHCWGFGIFSIDVVLSMEKYISDKLLTNEEIEVHSAFNGFAIYRTSKFVNCRYHGKISEIQQLFSKKSIVNTITFLSKLPSIKRIIENSNYVLTIHKPLNSIKNNHPRILKNKIIIYDEICEHISYHLLSKNNNARIIISSQNICKN